MQLTLRTNKMYIGITTAFPDIAVTHAVPTIYILEDIARHLNFIINRNLLSHLVKEQPEW